LDPGAVREWDGLLEGMCAEMDDLFVRSEPRGLTRAYVRGLLAEIPRKNCWQIAEHAGLARPDGLQGLLSSTPWDADVMRDRVRALVVDALGDPGAALIVDETADIKKGVMSAGVQRQHAGITGQVENNQTSVHLSYGSVWGRTLIDRELYVGAGWVADPARCATAGIPPERAEAVVTKPELARRMIERAVAAGVPFRWVCGDEAYGQNRALRNWLEARSIRYVLEVPCDESLPLPDGRTAQARELAALVPAGCFERRKSADGSKGPRLYDWAHVALAPAREGMARWLLIRRSITKTKKTKTGGCELEVAFFLCHAPAGTTLTDLVAAAGLRWMVEECFQASKGKVGLDEHEVRKWCSWYRHTTLCMLAMAFLAVVRRRLLPRSGTTSA